MRCVHSAARSLCVRNARAGEPSDVAAIGRGLMELLSVDDERRQKMEPLTSRHLDGFEWVHSAAAARVTCMRRYAGRGNRLLLRTTALRESPCPRTALCIRRPSVEEPRDTVNRRDLLADDESDFSPVATTDRAKRISFQAGDRCVRRMSLVLLRILGTQMSSRRSGNERQG